MLTDKLITKIEGHGSLEIDRQKGEVKLRLHGGERLFEGMLVGRTIEEAHWITPRICGVCPIAHNMASLRACENGLGIKINTTAELLRNLMITAQMMQSHMLHLFFLSLPDYLGVDRGTELAKKDPKSFAAALDIKEVSDEIAFVVGGRTVHPVTTTVGGFHKLPDKKSLKNLLSKIQKTRKSAERALNVCKKIKFPELKTELEFVAQINGEIASSKGDKTQIKDYKTDIGEEIKDYSTAKFGNYKKRDLFVGSLARLYFKKDCDSQLLNFQNPFYNNLAQGIELLSYHKEAEDILTKLLNMEMDPTIAKPETQTPDKQGIGAVEAPRGGLYHEFHFDKDNILTYANIITPTVQNLLSIEKSSKALLEQHSTKSDKEINHLLEMLVRAYDPCITCSVH